MRFSPNKMYLLTKINVMARKIYLTEAQFREYMRTKLHESRQSNGKKIRLTEEQMRMFINNVLKQ